MLQDALLDGVESAVDTRRRGTHADIDRARFGSRA